MVLWDIDGTLCRSDALGAAVIAEAIEAEAGRPARPLPLHGKTDPQIVREHLVDLGLAATDVQIASVLDGVVSRLADRREELWAATTVLPGVRAVLELLAARGDVHQSVVTGNLRPNAVLKLEAAGLAHLLDLRFMATGSDGADRNLLPGVSLARATEAGVQIDPRHTWVVGDTDRDLACARASGLRCLLVGTGVSPVPRAAQVDADAYRPDLSEVDEVVGLLVGR